MLQDRPYMRDSYERSRTSVLTWIISLIIAAFVVQSVTQTMTRVGYGLDSALGLSSYSLKAAHFWTLFTYGLLQDGGSWAGNLLQMITYVFVIYLAGREVLPVMGSRRFVGFLLSALVVGGLCWTATHWRSSEIIVGSSAAVWALIILYACFYPNREVQLVMFFVLPFTIKPKYVAYVLLAVDLCGFFFYEILGAASPFAGVAHSAHLGGMAVAWIYFRYLHHSKWGFGEGTSELELPRWMKDKSAAKAALPAAFGAVSGDKGHLKAEVDRILDKINSDGFGSLSAAEKKVLDEARDLIGRR